MNVGLYVRVSTREQERHGYSIATQLEKLRAYANARDYNVVKEYIDPAVSGAKLDRAGLNSLVADAKRGAIKGVLVYRLDRLSRSQKHTMYLIEDVFLKNDVAFISMTESFDTTTSFGRAMVGMLSIFAQLERDNITERLLSGRVQRAKRGKHHGGGIIPYGYRYDKETGSLKRFNEEANNVEEMFKMVADGSSLTKVADKFNTRDTTVRRRIENPLYTGVVRFDGETYEGNHDAIVSEELFQRANEKLNVRTSTLAFKRRYLLSGLLFCGKCGQRMSAYESRSKHNGKEYKTAYYRCNARTYRFKKKYDFTCSQPHIRVDKLEPLIIEKVKQLPFQPAKKVNNKKDIKRLEKTIENIDTKIERLLNLYLESHLGSELYKKKTVELEKEKAKALTELEKEIKKDSSPVKDNSWIKSIPWEDLETEAKREVLETVIDKIVITDNNVDVFFK